MSENRHVVEHVVDIALVVIAGSMLLLYASSRRPSGQRAALGEPKVPANWQDETMTGIRLGRADAPLTIIEFMDFQCPACASWSARVDSLLEEHGDEVQVVVHHYPLSIHPQAVAAAVAIECAYQQDRFYQLQRVLFARRRDVGVVPVSQLASEAGIPDQGRFEKCVQLPADSFPRIAYGRSLGERTGVRGTPTVWVNGVVKRPTLAEFRKLLADSRE
jgi:protein-disulfide isomerase